MKGMAEIHVTRRMGVIAQMLASLPSLGFQLRWGSRGRDMQPLVLGESPEALPPPPPLSPESSGLCGSPFRCLPCNE